MSESAAETFVPWEPRFDAGLGQFVALTLGDNEVYGDTWSECAKAWAECLEIEAAHLSRNGAWECSCVLPDQSCPVCREAARELYGGGEEPLPF